MSPLIISALVGIAILSVGLYTMTRLSREKQVGERVRQLKPVSGYEMGEDGMYQQHMGSSVFQEESKSSLAVTLENIMRSFGIKLEKFEDTVQLKFAQAGIHSPNALIYYVFMKRFGIWIGLGLAFVLMSGNEEGAMRAAVILVTIMVLVGSVLGADMYIRNRKEKRQKVLLRSFPDALDLILVCVESGLALDAALSRVTKELEKAHPEITKELNKTRMELTLLNDRQKALQNLAERTDLVPFRSLVASLLQSERFGTSLTETLRVLSDDYRQTRLMIAENKAGRLPALMTIPMMLLMMPAFVMIVMAPALIDFFRVWGGGK